MAAGIAVLSAALGIWLTGLPQKHKRVVPFSAGLLIGLVVFGILPDLADGRGWLGGAAMIMGGFGILWVVNRYIYPICPSCSHAHDHHACLATLHGFEWPLIIAAALHSLMDGWGIAASQQESNELGLAVFLGVALHKIPEGLAYGAILRAALQSRPKALGLCALAEAPTLAGGMVHALSTMHFYPHWVGVPLALAGGSFLYLGSHAVHTEWKSRGAAPALLPALTGLTSAALLREGLHFALH